MSCAFANINTNSDHAFLCMYMKNDWSFQISCCMLRQMVFIPLLLLFML